MTPIETIAREVCRAFGERPDELVQPLPAGRPYPAWQSYEMAAEAIWLWLMRYATATA